MSSAAAPTDSQADHATQRAEDAQYHRQMLHELAEMGMGIARALHRQATAEPAEPATPEAQPAAPTPSPAVAASAAFDRIARTVRRTIALARKLSDPDPPSPKARADEHRAASRERVISGVEDAIGREADDPEAEALDADLYECLDDPDDLDPDDDLDEQSLAALIAATSRAPGLATVTDAQLWARCTPDDVRDLRALAAQRRVSRPGTGQPAAAQPNAQPTAEDPRPLSPTHPGTGPPAP